ncbi:IPT/TIG domain-containing protein [Pinibacter soli]|uniref:IPT/TIG domain-containing protein n=1 Tax=Pinibacter soli TaxID=3044211 RepID=A0ABT6RHG4_9BACT|nr:IPT/TIG domain-containing protein [Pinibacter soli]MDI3322016.1 IPT/TIG domain-containing protein [Pinibacter soli]
MKIIYNVRLLLLTILIGSLCFIACKKDSAPANDGSTQLLSFGPTGASPGDTIRFFGNNLDKVTEIDFQKATVASNKFVRQSATEIYLVVPATTEKGYVTLKSPTGNVTSKTQFNIGIAATVTSITGTARPGDNVTITGNYLNWVSAVTFTDGKVATTFVSQSMTQIVVKVPVDAKTGTLVLKYAGTDSGFVETKDTLHVTLPKATALAPNPVKHQTNLTITGTDLDLTTKIYFTGVSAAVTTFVSQSATQIVVKVPASTTAGNVTLEAASGVQTICPVSLQVSLPAVTNMTPNPVDPLANLTITGTNLDLVTAVAFQNANAVTTFVSQSATQIVVKVPSGVTEGKITLSVLNSTLTVQSPNILQITGAVPPPTIALPFYKDAVTNWNGWTGDGWGGNKNYANTTPVREGDKSIKIDYVGGWGSPLQLGGATVAKGSYTTFKISIYGAPGSNGKTVNLQLNGAGGQSITIVEGKWTDYAFPLSSLISGANITDIILQETTGNGGFTVYVDAMGIN